MSSEKDEGVLFYNTNPEVLEIGAIIDSISNGIMVLDNEFKISTVNHVASKIFDINDFAKFIGKNISDCISDAKIIEMLGVAIEKKVCIEAEVELGNNKILKLEISPIKSRKSQDKIVGWIINIDDVTKIKKLEQIRTEFVSNVTHELKTPLTSIRGFIETLKSGTVNDTKRTVRFLDIIDIEAERLHLLITDILQLSEIESKKIDVDIVSIDLYHLVEEVFEIDQKEAKEKGLSLQNLVDKGFSFKANKNRMKQMLINLVHNAVKYNNNDGLVKVSARFNNGRVMISVKDTGIGIAQEHCPRVFERFYRVDKGRSRQMGGTGLGLSIVKHIVQLYGGEIKLISQIEKGSEFIIYLPQ